MQETIKPTLSVQEAADLLGVDHSTILRRLYAGAIEGEKRGKSWQIPAEQVERAIAQRRSAFSDLVDASTKADAVRQVARAGLGVTTLAVRKVCQQVADTGRDLDERAGTDPAVYGELLETFEGAIVRLRQTLALRAHYEAMYVDLAHLEAKAATLSGEVGEDFNQQVRARRERDREGKGRE